MEQVKVEIVRQVLPRAEELGHMLLSHNQREVRDLSILILTLITFIRQNPREDA